MEGKPIKVFNHGDLYRDFTYIDDIVDGISNIINNPISKNFSSLSKEESPQGEVVDNQQAPYKVYNIGNSTPVKLMDFIETIEKSLEKEAVKEYHDMQPGDVYKTFADVSALEKDFGYSPDTPLSKGINEFVKWYKSYYK